MAEFYKGQIILTEDDQEALRCGFEICKSHDHWLNRLIGWKCSCDSKKTESDLHDKILDSEIKSIKEEI